MGCPESKNKYQTTDEEQAQNAEQGTFQNEINRTDQLMTTEVEHSKKNQKSDKKKEKSDKKKEKSYKKKEKSDKKKNKKAPTQNQTVISQGQQFGYRNRNDQPIGKPGSDQLDAHHPNYASNTQETAFRNSSTSGLGNQQPQRHINEAYSQKTAASSPPGHQDASETKDPVKSQTTETKQSTGKEYKQTRQEIDGAKPAGDVKKPSGHKEGQGPMITTVQVGETAGNDKTQQQQRLAESSEPDKHIIAKASGSENQTQDKREPTVSYDKQSSPVAPKRQDLQQEVNSQRETIDKLRKEKEEMQKALDESKEKQEDLEKIRIELEDELKETRARADKIMKGSDSKIKDDIARKDKEVAELNGKIGKLETERNNLQQEVNSCNSKIKNMKDMIEAKTAEQEALEKRMEVDIASQRNKIVDLEKEKADLLLRLSAMAGRRLTDNNPDIADLSDINRPTKLAEKYSELYDNAWTDAFTYLQSLDKYKESEQDIIACLLSMLIMAYTVSLKSAENQLQTLGNVLDEFRGNIEKDQQVKDVMKQLKDCRKKVTQPSKKLTAEYIGNVKRKHPELQDSSFDSGVLRSYLEQCLELCWLMVIQDPPVHLKCEFSKKGELFDKNAYKEYTVAGKYVAYTVWPAVYLEKDGALLCKGVAQCDKRLSGSLRTPANKEKGLELKTGSLKFPEGRSLHTKDQKADKKKTPPDPAASTRF